MAQWEVERNANAHKEQEKLATERSERPLKRVVSIKQRLDFMYICRVLPVVT
jgi:hypothetical protein